MTINSLEFALFLGTVFFLYYFPLKEQTRAQNILLLGASYVFYGIANWKMIPLLAVITGIFYGLGRAIGKAGDTKQGSLLTALGVCLGLALLLYFKYLNFFISSFADLCTALGLAVNRHTFNIIMPLGLSFFTFKLISYVVEVHDHTMEPERDIISFAVYTAFFPALAAGPIDRPNVFLPQLQAKRTFNYALAVDGCRQMLWGMAKKMLIADKLAVATDTVWANIAASSGLNLLLTVFFYALQLYADFSGYSDMAIGVGKLLGFRITRNFNYPFFGRTIAEYWRNWHISLTSWLTDYVFIPLHSRFHRLGKAGLILTTMINFLLVGLWHGANWTFAALGLYHGLLYIPLILSGEFGKNRKRGFTLLGLPSLKDFAGMATTFTLVSFGLIMFRAENIVQAWDYVRHIADFSVPFTIAGIQGKKAVLLAAGMMALEWYGFRHKMEYAFCAVTKLNTPCRYLIYLLLCLLVSMMLFGTNTQEFIYQQF
ncbi:MAG: hypothetical protein LBU17_08590 [Treponema sp.]|jgi:D-alanyl-lipoteichoic acid acyltransferase DltB (MBOAT superfamily)|nr:hypothetical protein [Treponema sp.]